jgi:hypothetical protein
MNHDEISDLEQLLDRERLLKSLIFVPLKTTAFLLIQICLVCILNVYLWLPFEPPFYTKKSHAMFMFALFLHSMFTFLHAFIGFLVWRKFWNMYHRGYLELYRKNESSIRISMMLPFLVDALIVLLVSLWPQERSYGLLHRLDVVRGLGFLEALLILFSSAKLISKIISFFPINMYIFHIM